MKPRMKYGLIAGLASLALAGCGQEHGGAGGAVAVRQTGFPGQVSAGGGTSGQVMAQASQNQQAVMPAGTPGIPKGAQGNVGGTQMGASVEGTSAQQSGERKTSAQSTGAQSTGNQGSGAQSGGGAGVGAEAPPSASMPPLREGRGATGPDASHASSITRKGNVAAVPSAGEQAQKEKAK